MGVRLYWDSTALAGGPMIGKTLDVGGNADYGPLTIDISVLKNTVNLDSYGYFEVKRVHTSPLIKNQFTDIFMLSTD